MDLNAEAIAAGAVAVIVAIGKVTDHFKGRKRDRSHGETISSIKTSLSKEIQTGFQTMDRRMDTLELSLTEVRAFCIGPDGENGFRSDIKELKKKVTDIENRDRDRLERTVDSMKRTG